MNPLNILYIGASGGTCLDRANAYRRLGHSVKHVDPRKLLPTSNWVDRITWKFGGHLFSPLIQPRLQKELKGDFFDVCHVDNGEWVSPNVIKTLKSHSKYVINYNIDDPTGPRDGPRFKAYRLAAKEYDLLAVVRNENISELQTLGARNVIRVYRSADEINHAPRQIKPETKIKWKSEVLFLGTWMPERGPLLAEMASMGVPLTIIGDHWHKAPEWEKLKPHWKGPSLHGDDYAYAIQCAKINIGLVSKGNRDLHTTRSLEIPSLGGLLCAERTSEHVAMYRENVEALFWENAEECARVCMNALSNDQERENIAQAGRARFLANKHGNEDILRHLLEVTQSDPITHSLASPHGGE